MQLNNIQILKGPWWSGVALDLHTISSRWDPIKKECITTYSELGELMHNLKYHKFYNLKYLIADAIAEYLKEQPYLSSLSAIIPMPPSDTERPIQPLNSIANALDGKIDLKIDFDYLSKKTTPRLITIQNPDERKKILSGVFQVKDGRYSGKNVLLLDDLYRSGATMSAATRALYKYGKVSRVYVIAITKTRVRR